MQQLSYIGLGVVDFDAWRAFAVGTLGLMPDGGAETMLLRLDTQAYRLELHKAANDDLLYMGIEFENAAEVDAMHRSLTESGMTCTALEASESAQRQIAGGCWLLDPDGVRIELVHGVAQAKSPFESGLNIGFVTGEGGLGHVVLAVSDADRSIAYYEKLGFKISDFINAAMGPDFTLRIAFMHCNPRHHSLAMAQLPGGKRLNHIMIEVDRVDDVMQAHRRCVDNGYQPGSIGRHTNDEMFSFYVRTPSGFDIEYGWGGKEISGEWAVQEYDKISHWGHERA